MTKSDTILSKIREFYPNNFIDIDECENEFDVYVWDEIEPKIISQYKCQYQESKLVIEKIY